MPDWVVGPEARTQKDLGAPQDRGAQPAPLQVGAITQETTRGISWNREMTDNPKSTNNLELFSTEVFQIICGPWAHRLRRYRFPVPPRGPAPTTSGGGAIPRDYSWHYLESLDDR